MRVEKNIYYMYISFKEICFYCVIDWGRGVLIILYFFCFNLVMLFFRIIFFFGRKDLVEV